LPRLSSRAGLTGSGLIRVAIGTSLLLRPSTLPKALGVDSATAARVGWLSPMVGARDVALGAGLVHAARRDRNPRPWLVAAAFADAVDALAFGSALVRGHVRRAAGVVCTGAALSGVGIQLATLDELTEHEGSSSG
jgi:hypothetical protein